MRKVIVHLHAQPRVGGAADSLFEAHGHFGRDAAAPGNHLVKLLTRDAERLGGVFDGNAKLREIVGDDLAGMLGGSSSSWVNPPSMVVHKVDIERLAVLKPENHTPVGAHRDRPKTFEVASQRMQPESRHV
jgi:hypothetical protein